MAKRSDYISWDEYFMGVAILAAQRSKDPNTQVGACIVSNDNKILSIGYNGMPLNCRALCQYGKIKRGNILMIRVLPLLRISRDSLLRTR